MDMFSLNGLKCGFGGGGFGGGSEADFGGGSGGIWRGSGEDLPVVLEEDLAVVLEEIGDGSGDEFGVVLEEKLAMVPETNLAVVLESDMAPRSLKEHFHTAVETEEVDPSSAEQAISLQEEDKVMRAEVQGEPAKKERSCT
nr:uncharacterized protein LOC113800018 [Penaeus vannamei]